MGFFAHISTAFGISRKQLNIMMIGLDNSGKSTIINQMKPSDVQSTQVKPTIGYSNEKFVVRDTAFMVYDLSGQAKYRNLWETYYKEVNGIVFVVDSTDRLRIAVARDELWMLLDHKDIASRKVPLVVLANKMTERGAMGPAEMNQCLGLDLIRSRAWHICATCALSGQGLDEAFQWLAENIRCYLQTQKHK